MPSRSNSTDEKRPTRRLSSIQDELELLLSMATAGDKFEADLDRSRGSTKDPKDKASKSRKIKYDRSDDGLSSSRHTGSRDADDDNKSHRSKKSVMSERRKNSRSSGPSKSDEIPQNSRSSYVSYDSSDDIDPNSRKGRRKKDSRKIRYKGDEGGKGGVDGKDRDEKSVLSKKSIGSSLSRSSHGKKASRSKSNERGGTLSPSRISAAEERSALSRSRHKKISYKKEDSPESAQERNRDARSVRSRNSTRKLLSKPDEPKHLVPEKYNLEDFSSGDEDEDEIEVGLNDGRIRQSPEGENRGLRRRSSTREITTQRRTPGSRRGSLMRAMSMERNFNQSTQDDGAPKTTPGGRRPPRRASGVVSTDMILGDPSRRAPPSRSKSNDFSQLPSSRLVIESNRRAAPSRSKSDDFADFLRQRGMEPPVRKQRPSRRRPSIDDIIPLSALQADEKSGEDDNPFEVTYQSNHKSSSSGVSDAWDPFSADDSYGELDGEDAEDSPVPFDRQGKLMATKSGGLLQASSRDTMARGKFVRKEEQIEDVAKSEREKQRRADYRKSIVAATTAGRRQSMRQRQARQSSTAETLLESVTKLEAALEAR